MSPRSVCNIAGARAVVTPKSGNGLEVRSESPVSHISSTQFDIVLRFPLQAPAGLNAIQITVDAEVFTQPRPKPVPSKPLIYTQITPLTRRQSPQRNAAQPDAFHREHLQADGFAQVRDLPGLGTL